MDAQSSGNSVNAQQSTSAASADELLETYSLQARIATENANRLASMAEEQRRIARAAVAALRQLHACEPIPAFDPTNEEDVVDVPKGSSF